MSSSLPFKTFCQAIAQALCADGIPYDAGRVQRGVRDTLRAMGLDGQAQPLPAPAQLIEPFLQRWVPLLEHELNLEVVESAGQPGFRGMPTLNARLAQLRQGAPRAVRMELDLPSFCEGLSQALATDGVVLGMAWLENSWLALASEADSCGARQEDGRWKLELRWLAVRYPAWREHLAAVLGCAGGNLRAWPHVDTKLAQLEQVMRSQHLLAEGQGGSGAGWIGQTLAAAAAGEPASQVNARMHRARYGLRAVH